MRLPFDIGTIHFVGIGGIGMSGLAQALHDLGFQVRGSDAVSGKNVERLRGMGVEVRVGHDASYVEDAGVVVTSSAVGLGNVEVKAARERGLAVIPRAEMLAELMRFRWNVGVGGSHGKTTTTSLLSAALEGGGVAAGVVNGGVVKAWGSSARMSGGVGEAGGWMVVEADESDGTFLHLPLTVAVVTNVDAEHLERHGGMEGLRRVFLEFMRGVPFYGFVAVCGDDAEAEALARECGRRVLRYGTKEGSWVRGLDWRVEGDGVSFGVERGREMLGRVRLPTPGEHNMMNALGAIAVALELGASWEGICKGLEGFGGVGRRFELAGRWRGARIYDDYGHHPTEIRATLGAARGLCSGRLTALVQPHRPSRLEALMEEFAGCFEGADRVLAAPVYRAGEEAREGADSEELVRRISASGVEAKCVSGLEETAAALGDLGEGDVVVCLGAGDITALARDLEGALEVMWGGE